MFDLLPLLPKDIQTLIRHLTANPLLASLFLISPPDALRYMGFNLLAALFDDLRPTTEGDIRRVQQLLEALHQGRTTLEEVQVVQPATPTEETPPQPAEETPATGQQPDVQFSVSKTMLQQVLALYTQHTFKGQVFTMPTQRWGEVNLVGESLSLDLRQGQARIVATFQGMALLRMPMPLGLNVELGTLNSPTVLDVLTTISIDRNDMLTLDIRHGEIRLTRVPLPEIVAAELARQLIAAVPTIPLVKMPTRFELPNPRGDIAKVVAFKPGTVRIEPEGVWLEFQLDQGEDASD
jgi:hypothetical protein